MDPRPASPVLDHNALTPPRLHTPRPGNGAGVSPPRRDASNGEAAQSPAAPTPVPLRDMLADALLCSGGDSRSSGVRGGRTAAGSSGAVGQTGSGSIQASGVTSISDRLGGSIKGGGLGSPAASAGGQGSQGLTTPGNTPRSKGYPVVSWTAGSASAREPPGPPPSPGPQAGGTPQRSPEQRAAPLSAREAAGHGSIISALWSRGTPATQPNHGSGQLCGTPDQSPPPSARDVPRKSPDVSLPGTPKGPAPQAVPGVSSGGSNHGTPLRRPLLQQQQRLGHSGTSHSESVERRPSGSSVASHSMPGADARDSSRSADISRRRAGYPSQVAQQSTPPAASTPQQQHPQQGLPQSPRPEARYVIRQPLTLGSVPRTGINTTPLSARARTGPASQTMGQLAPQGSLSARETTSRGATHPTVGSSNPATRSTQSTQSPMARMAYPTAWAFGGRMR